MVMTKEYPPCEETAYHEAGHAVAQIELDNSFAYLLVEHAPGQGGKCKGQVEPKPGDPPEKTVDNAERVERWSMAGVVARHQSRGDEASVAIFKEQDADWKQSARPWVKFLAKEWYGDESDENVEKVLETMMERTKAMFDTNTEEGARCWRAVTALAKEAVRRLHEEIGMNRPIVYDKVLSIIEESND